MRISKLIFSEIYSLYYKTVGKILNEAFERPLGESEVREIINENAFSESALFIIPALKSGRWNLLNGNFSPALKHEYTLPLTLIEKRWLKSILADPKIKLFGLEIPELYEVQPLFNYDDYKIYDKYADGDDFANPEYIANFRLILNAVKNESVISVKTVRRSGKEIEIQCVPVGFEYSLKDDKIRVKVSKCRYSTFNLGRITACGLFEGEQPRFYKTKEPQTHALTLLIKDERNALERVSVHFSHYEKQASRRDDGSYILKLKYNAEDETEILIRVLQFGPMVKVMGPETLVNSIKERLKRQKSFDLK